MELLINFLAKSIKSYLSNNEKSGLGISAKDSQKEVDLHLGVKKIAIPFFMVDTYESRLLARLSIVLKSCDKV